MTRIIRENSDNSFNGGMPGWKLLSPFFQKIWVLKLKNIKKMPAPKIVSLMQYHCKKTFSRKIKSIFDTVKFYRKHKLCRFWHHCKTYQDFLHTLDKSIKTCSTQYWYSTTEVFYLNFRFSENIFSKSPPFFENTE